MVGMPSRPPAAVLQTELVEDLRCILHRAAFRRIVERGEHQRLPQVPDRALGLPRSPIPLGYTFVVTAHRTAAKLHQTACDGELIGSAQHWCAQEASGVLQWRGQSTDLDGRRARAVCRGCRFQPGLPVVPADLVGEASAVLQVDQIRAATHHDVLRIDHLFERGMQIRIRAAADVGATLEDRDLSTIAGKRLCRRQPGDTRADDNNLARRVAIG